MKVKQKFAVLGFPAKHSLSPRIFNFLKEYFKIDLSYEVLEIEPSHFLNSFDKIKEFDGINITSPYKEKILEFSKKKSSEVEILKAANVLKKVNGDKFEAHNTDVMGFKQSLEPFKITNKKALVLGSSGAARAVILGLYQMGIMDIFVKARDYSSFKKFNIPIQEYTDQKPELVVQATTIGLNQESNKKLPKDTLDFFNIDYSKTEIAYDLIYTPKITTFMEISQKQGVPHVMNGENMLILQALRTFDLWFGPQGEKSSNTLEKIKEKIKEIL